ncbi:hypothetical protein [Actinoplanes sp. NPDC049599]|uniref:hypothetical protein n=1 Tax=Actinoplanes sp. NPDC049599 TaxID=3363903 RepID=UPI0037AD3E11
MPFTFQAQPDASLFRAAARRSARTYAVCLGAFFIVAALIAAAGFHSYGLAALYLVMAVVFALRVPGQMAERGVRNNAATIGLVTGYRLDERGIGIAAGFQEHFYAWSEVAAVEEWPGQFAVFVGPRFASTPHRRMAVQLGRRIVSVPTGGLSEQQHAELRALLHSRGATVAPAAAE